MYQKLNYSILGGNTGKTSQYLLQEDVIYWKDKWYILNIKKLQLAIIKNNHDSHVAGYFDIYKTIEQWQQNFQWQKMNANATDYVRACKVR